MSDRHYQIVEDIMRAPPDLVDAFHGVASSDVHEAMGKIGAMAPEISPVTSTTALHGTAVTVSLPPGDNAGIHLASSVARPGDVLIIEAQTTHAATWGELATRNAINVDIEGVVSNGNIRDVDDIEALDFPVFAQAVGQKGAVKHRSGSVNIPVTVGGVVVEPGDIIVGDADGVTVVPRERAAAGLKATHEKETAEANLRERMEAGEELPDLLGVWNLVEDGVRVTDPADYTDEHDM